MSHLHERKEKICLNCKSVVYGRFCHVCGQENVEPRESAWGLITHFVYDLTHFDGKFFTTLKYLLFRPGYISREYLRGRRASYLHPIRMYIFTSAFFFLIFFSFISNPEDDALVKSEDKRMEFVRQKIKLKNQLQTAPDSLKRVEIKEKLDAVQESIDELGKAGLIQFNTEDTVVQNEVLDVGEDSASTIAQYDSIQHSLPPKKRDGWLYAATKRKIIAINEKYRNNRKLFWSRLQAKFLHSIPQMMFVSLPLVALVLQLLYARRKQFYYVNHVIFTIHMYIALYLLILFIEAFVAIYHASHLSIFKWLAIVSYLAIFFYIYKALRNFYQQRRGKTIFKFFLLLLLSFLMFTLLMTVYFLTSAMLI